MLCFSVQHMGNTLYDMQDAQSLQFDCCVQAVTSSLEHGEVHQPSLLSIVKCAHGQS